VYPVANASASASGDHAGSRLGSGPTVICRTLVPSAYITQISVRLVKAIRRPSGENCGSAGRPGASSRCTRPPPAERRTSWPDELARPS
jgi:hypothetical protein